MIVPTGRVRVATRTSGPCGTTGAAWASGAAAPLNMFLAMIAVTPAMRSAPTSSTIFLTSMAIVAPLCGTEKNFSPYSSSKLVKKTFANQPKPSEGDGHPVGNFELLLALRELVPDQVAEGQHAPCQRHQEDHDQDLLPAQPQCERGDQLDVAAAHRSHR